MTSLDATPDPLYQLNARPNLDHMQGRFQSRTTQTTSIFSLEDLFWSAPRGVEGFLQSLYQLSDTILGDALPDIWDERFLGRSTTVIGGLGEGMAQFLTGFVPMAGVLSRGAQFSRAAKGASAGLKGMSKIGRSMGAGGRALAARGEKLAETITSGVGKTQTFGQALKTDLVAGALADFTAFDGNEARLSNLIKGTPLENIVTNYLAAEEDDPELEGRLKNVLEGMGLTMFMSPLVHALRLMFKTKKAIEAGADPAEAMREQNMAADPEILVGGREKALAEMDSRTIENTPPSARPDEAKFRTPSEEPVLPEGVAKLEKEANAALQKANAADSEIEQTKHLERYSAIQKKIAEKHREAELQQQFLDEGVEQRGKDKELFQKKVTKGDKDWGPAYEDELEGGTYRLRKNKKDRMWYDMTDPENPVKLTNKPDAPRTAAVRRLRSIISGEGALEGEIRAPKPIDALPVKKMLEVIRQGIENKEILPKGGAINPRERQTVPGGGKEFVYSAEDLVKFGLERSDINLSDMMGMDSDWKPLVRAIEQVVEGIRGPLKGKVTLEDMDRIALKEIKRNGLEPPLHLLRGNELDALAAKAMDSVEDNNKFLTAYQSRMFAVTMIMEHAGRGLADTAKNLRLAYNSGDAARIARAEREAVAQAMVTYGATANRSASGTVAGRVLRSFRRDALGLDVLFDDMFKAAKRASKGDGGALKEWSRLMETFESDPLGAVALLHKSMTGVSGWKIMNEWVMGAMLGGGRTLTVNAMSGLSMAAFLPIEKALGKMMAGRSEYVQETRAVLSSLLNALQMARKQGWEVAKANEPKIVAGSKMDDAKMRTKAITSQNVGKLIGKDLEGTLAGSVVDALGKVARYPGAALLGTDEAAKILHVYAETFDYLFRVGEKKGVKDPAKWALEQQDRIVHNGQLINEEVLFTKNYDEIRANEADAFDSAWDMAVEARKRTMEQWNPENGALEILATQFGTRKSQFATFQNRTPHDGTTFDKLTIKVQEIMQVAPFLRPIVPFITTPYNILKWAGNRTVDPALTGLRFMFSKDLQEAFNAAKHGLPDVKFVESNKWRGQFQRDMIGDVDLPKGIDPESPEAMAYVEMIREEAKGRAATGVAMFAAFNTAVATGVITGAAPKDKEQRRLLEQAGWQPYSIKVGDSWVEYRRLDPFATILGTFADMFTVSQFAHQDANDPIGAAAVALIGSITNNFTNKTYMQGLSMLLDAVQDPVNEGPRIWRTALSGWLVPSGPAQAINFLAGDHDPMAREARSAVDAMLNKLVPYYGENNLDPVRNFMGETVRKVKSVGGDIPGPLGEFLNMSVPIAHSETSDDMIAQELVALEHAFHPPRVERMGVDLLDETLRTSSGRSAYDRMLELRSEVTVNGDTMRKAIRKLIRSPDYQRMDPTSTEEFESPRIQEIRRIIQRFDRASYNQLLREIPAIGDRIQQLREQREMSRLGILQEVR